MGCTPSGRDILTKMLVGRDLKHASPEVAKIDLEGTVCWLLHDHYVL